MCASDVIYSRLVAKDSFASTVSAYHAQPRVSTVTTDVAP
jgi:hypothetical protein